ncbi:MAG: hypothetical protein Q7V63_09675 [Gammaproteobacteria bacterium]|nr:hypothetical protein [Gammaproteobacteria bacterium]
MSDAVSAPKKSKIKIKFVWPVGYETQAKAISCLLGISVGQSKYEGLKLLATLEKINKNFGKCTIMLADSLQRYSIKTNNPGLNWDHAYEIAIHMGDSWLDRNLEHLKKLTIPFEVKRWDSWLNHPDYPACRKMIEIASNENNEFHMSVFETIKEIAVRFDKRNESLNCLRLFKYSPDYVKEECAVQLLMANEGYDFVAYAGGCNFAMEKTHDFFIKPVLPCGFDWLNIKIKS